MHLFLVLVLTSALCTISDLLSCSMVPMVPKFLNDGAKVGDYKSLHHLFFFVKGISWIKLICLFMISEASKLIDFMLGHQVSRIIDGDMGDSLDNPDMEMVTSNHLPNQLYV